MYTESLTNGTGVQLEIKVDPKMCHIHDENWMHTLDFNTKCAM